MNISNFITTLLKHIPAAAKKTLRPSLSPEAKQGEKSRL